MSRDLLQGNVWIRHLIWRAMRILARDLTPRGVQLLTRGIADVLWFVDARGRRTVEHNVTPLIPDRAARQRTVRHCYRACAEQLAFTLRLDRRPLRPPHGIRVIDPWGVFAATPLTGPVIIAASHVDWDMVLSVLNVRQLVNDVAVVALPAGDPWVDAELAMLRLKAGAKTLSWIHAARESLHHVRSGGTLGVLADRNYSSASDRARILTTNGYQRHLSTGPAELARRSNALLIPVAIVHGAMVVGKPYAPHTTSEAILATEAIANFHLRAVATAPGRWVAFHPIWNRPS